MQRTAATISIERPPETVFRLLSPDQMLRWYVSDGAHLQRASAPTPAPGVRYSIVYRMAFGEFPAEVEVLDYQPPTFLKSRAWNEHYEGILTVLLEPGNLGTVVKMTEEFSVKGGLGKLLEPFFSARAQARAEKALLRLKQMAEAS